MNTKPTPLTYVVPKQKAKKQNKTKTTNSLINDWNRWLNHRLLTLYISIGGMIAT